jgi:ABC-type multidrug transport system fused ATPase/permease subunit
MISYSGQDSFLFSASISENITFDGQEENKEVHQRLMEVLHTSALADDMELFPDGVKALVGEKGVRVSGGQRQRISLARALYAENPILILDDPFSAVDIGTEKRMIERIRGKLKDKTIILFSHRLSSFKDADNILVLDKGRIAEHGNHDELMGLNGIYQRIYSAQHWMEDEANE